ncbi:MAG: S-layer homology domain-containing protein [Oscillospiraceae bacterium]|nr:S-layer homology domain-containing protein [Oscillospiraceae bacterium]
MALFATLCCTTGVSAAQLQGEKDGAAVIAEDEIAGDAEQSALSEPDASAAEEEPEAEHVTVTFYANNRVLAEIDLNPGDTLQEVPQVDADENEISFWLDQDEDFVTPTGQIITEDTNFYAYYSPVLNTQEHIRYIQGDGTGRIYPEDEITRAQAAQIVYSLLQTQSMGRYEHSFSDVPQDSWYDPAVSTLASLNVLDGDQNGLFHPDETMTRAEFVTMLSRFYPLAQGTARFTDVSDSYWAQTYIQSAANQGWITGYSDGSFRPDDTMTRAQAVVIMNRVLGRSADQQVLREHSFRIFADLQENHWAFADFMEATVQHTHTSNRQAAETWSRYVVPTAGMTPGMHTIDNALYYIDADTLQFDSYTKGFQTIDGKLYYAGADGLALTIYSAGLMDIDSAMYYANGDGTFLTSGMFGHLQFNASGEYTTGDLELNDLVEAELNKCVNDAMTQSEKLRAIYDYVRDNFTYLNREHQARGTTLWTTSYAIEMIKTRQGNCYSFSSVFMYMAQRVGYDAYPISGGLGTNNQDHAWVMINMDDGKAYMFDTQLEWRYQKKVDLYMMTRDKTPFQYYFPS